MKLEATIWAVLLASILPFGAGAGSARAQFAEPLRIGNKSPLKDVFGRNLDSVGQVGPSRVDLFTIEALGKPAKLLTNTFVGANAMTHSGFFSTAIPARPAAGTTIRAVAYDAATSNDASFFSSASATVPATGRILLDFSAPKPMAKFASDMDAAYADALDRLRASGVDSDNDGMTDYEEVLAGTELEDASRLLAFETIEPAASTPRVASRDADGGDDFIVVVVQWQSVPDHTYQLQYTPSLLPDGETGEVPWNNIGPPMTAEKDELSIRVTVELDEEEAFLRGHFRVLLVL